MAKEKEKTSLVDLLSSATEDDLAAIVTEIEAKESQRAAYLASIDGDIAGLRALHKVLDLKLHGKKPRKAKGVNDNGERVMVGTGWAEKIFDLITAEGSMPVGAIAERLQARPAAIGKAVSASDWFKKVNGEVCIARS